MAVKVSPENPGSENPEAKLAPWSCSSRNFRPLAIGPASSYAQEHSLTFDFYEESSKRAAAHLIALKGDSSLTKTWALTSYSHLTQCTIPAQAINDLWLDSESSAQYCHWFFSSLDDPCAQSLHALEPRYLAAKRARCGIPILKSDNNLDLLDIAYNIYARRAVPSADISIPQIDTETSGDEGLCFPSWSDQLVKHFDNHLSREAIRNLHDLELSEVGIANATGGITKHDKQATCELIDAEFTAYKEQRVRALAQSASQLEEETY